MAPSSGVNSLNLTINLRYKISEKFDVGFNINAIGISFIPTGNAFLHQKWQINAKFGKSNFTKSFVGDNDKGSLNSHLFVRYKLSDHLGLKLACQYLSNELTTTTKIQTVPSANDRFRAKSTVI